MAKSVVQTPQHMKGKSLTVTLLNQESLSETKTTKEDETDDKPKTETDLKSEESATSESACTPEIDGKMEEILSGITNVNDVRD